MPFTIEVTTAEQSPRLEYVLDELCAHYGWVWTYRREGQSPGTAAELYYGAVRTDAPTHQRGVVNIQADGLLDAAPGGTSQSPQWGMYDGVACPTGKDPLSGAFYCLALLGDYADRPVDRHGRLPASNHPLVLRGVSRVPIADRLLHALAARLWRAGGEGGAPALLQEGSSASSDIDAPRALNGKPLPKRVTSLARGLISEVRAPHGSAPPAGSRWLDYVRGRADPFDTFAYMHAAAAARGLREDFFTLVGYGTRLDPGWPPGHGAWEGFWRKLPPASRLGIHPSYYASERPELLHREVRHLRSVIGRAVTTSRQHFLRLRIPDTFRALLDVGITEDHSLMWADADGFRAGTARSFLWYDIQHETVTPLRLFPPHAMDVTARYYEGLSPKQAVASWAALAAEARASGTALRCIWHNSNLGPWYGWWPWRAAYEASLDLSVIP